MQAVAQVLPGHGIQNHCSGAAGTLGCEVRHAAYPGKRFALTCYHVIRTNHDLGFYAPLDPPCNTVCPEGNLTANVGDVFWGVLTPQLDVALIEWSNDAPADVGAIPHIGKVTDYARLTADMIRDQPTVRFLGKQQKYVRYGQIIARNQSVLIGYDFSDFTAHTLHGLLGIQGYDQKAISQKGDSGALLVDNDNNAVGIIVAANPEMTYAIPFSSIIEQTSIRLIPQPNPVLA